MVRGDHPPPAQTRVSLVSTVNYGPQAPSIATARLAVTCGFSLNNAMASAVNMLGDVHGGAGEKAVELFHQVQAFDGNIAAALQTWFGKKGNFIAGFGHLFDKPIDPRAPRLLALVAEAVEDGACSVNFSKTAQAIDTDLTKTTGQPLPMNIDCATAVIYAELGFAPPFARGLFGLSCSVGILAHAWEQMNQEGRNKGSTPPH